MNVKELILDAGYEGVIVFEEPSYDTAFIGVTTDNRAVYDYDKMLEWHVNNEGMDWDEAADFISYNDSFHYGEGYPLILCNLTTE